MLDDEQINQIRQFATELEVPQEILSFNTGTQTGFVDGTNIIHIMVTICMTHRNSELVIGEMNFEQVILQQLVHQD